MSHFIKLYHCFMCSYRFIVYVQAQDKTPALETTAIKLWEKRKIGHEMKHLKSCLVVKEISEELNRYL